MHQNALPLLILLGSLAFAAAPSAFIARSAWSNGGWQRAIVAIAGLALLSMAITFSLSSPFNFNAQWEAGKAVVIVWHMILALAAMIWVVRRITGGVSAARN